MQINTRNILTNMSVLKMKFAIMLRKCRSTTIFNRNWINWQRREKINILGIRNLQTTVKQSPMVNINHLSGSGNSQRFQTPSSSRKDTKSMNVRQKPFISQLPTTTQHIHILETNEQEDNSFHSGLL